ncbi:MAG: GrpB family protein [Planctomycetes bacterium]|nr:GrpB family protein [Planctomycetota bacterium]MBL7041492.1 GrpB family protein [Pirellulaceae bacterium]
MFENVQPVIADYENRPVVCREHDPRAATVARLVAAEIFGHLPQVCAEHVGSTAVPGCAGNGIVDLMIPVPDGDMESVKGLLDRLGFQRQTNRDPFPEDRPMRVGAWNYDGEPFLLHVHVIPADSPEVEERRFFRACLRADPELLKLYVARKQQIIAGGVTDSFDYCRAKGEFIKEVFG